jgi:hypothetical protein
MIQDTKTFLGDSLKKQLLVENTAFADLINTYKEEGLVFDFGPKEWEKINSQNFQGLPGGFMTVFEQGINIGNCAAIAKLLSYSYIDVSIVTGALPILTGTPGSPLGGHAWLEDNEYIYDTTLLLKINKCLKDKFGYKDDVILKWNDLMSDPMYRSRREFVNDRGIKK